jgi:prefoldin beta subunit
MMQKQQIELEIVETERALEELNKITTSDSIYKAAGPLLIKSEKDTIEKELSEKKELANTRVMVLGKQESRVKENLKEVENKINQMLKGTQSTTQK